MTCGKKHCANAPTEATRVDHAEVEGRPMCDHPGCDKRVVGDGSKCADGHGQGQGTAAGPAAPSKPLGGYSKTYARLEELRWLEDPLGMFIRIRLQRDFEQRLGAACTELHQQLFPRRKRFNVNNLPQAQVAALANRISQELSAELQAAQAEYLSLRRHLDDLAASVELTPGATTETCLNQSYRRTYGSQTQERRYARQELAPQVELLEQAGFTARVEETAQGFALWSNAEPWQLDALRRRSALSPLDWALGCWRRGVNPKVYNPFLDDEVFAKSLELYTLEQRSGSQ